MCHLVGCAAKSILFQWAHVNELYVNWRYQLNFMNYKSSSIRFGNFIDLFEYLFFWCCKITGLFIVRESASKSCKMNSLNWFIFVVQWLSQSPKSMRTMTAFCVFSRLDSIFEFIHLRSCFLSGLPTVQELIQVKKTHFYFEGNTYED